MKLQAPFPWFGGKSRVADIVWQRLGDVPNYVEPFAGSLAVLLQRPHEPKVETVNDLDGFIANFWRAVKCDPEGAAHYADWPVNENDLHARHAYLVGMREEFTRKLEGDPEFFDAKIAGWWVWGICCWIGRGWCSGDGPWRVVDGKLVHLGNAGRGVNRNLVHLGNAGKGVNRSRVHLGDAWMGVNRRQDIQAWFGELSERLRGVRVCSGDWSRVCGPTPTVKQGLTGVFLDPPYADTAGRDTKLYAQDSQSVAHEVREWAIRWGDDTRMRIALCGYEGEHDMPESWLKVSWKAHGGYGSQGDGNGRENAGKERIWFSPHCLQVGLFE